VIGIDTNLLVYAHRRDVQWHATAKQLIEDLASSPSPWAIPWACVHEFVSTVTRPRLFDPPSTLEQAFDTLEDIARSESLVLLHEGPRHLERLRALAEGGKALGPRIHDARIAAICLDGGVRELWTADRDFSRFPALKTRNPLVSGTNGKA